MRPLRSPRMALFRRKSEPRARAAPASREGLLDEIARLTAASGAAPRARHRAAAAPRPPRLPGCAVDAAERVAGFAAPDAPRSCQAGRCPSSRPPTSPRLLRAGILRDGCVLVRGLVPRRTRARVRRRIDAVFADHARGRDGMARLYEEFEPDIRFEMSSVRPWIKQGGGVLATDSPALTYEMLDLFASAGLPQSGRGLPRRARAALDAEDDAAQGRAVRARRMAPGRRVHGRGHGRSTCGSRSRTAATRRPGWTCAAPPRPVVIAHER